MRRLLGRLCKGESFTKAVAGLNVHPPILVNKKYKSSIGNKLKIRFVTKYIEERRYRIEDRDA